MELEGQFKEVLFRGGIEFIKVLGNEPSRAILSSPPKSSTSRSLQILDVQRVQHITTKKWKLKGLWFGVSTKAPINLYEATENNHTLWQSKQTYDYPQWWRATSCFPLQMSGWSWPRAWALEFLSIDCSWTCHGWGCFWISSTTCKCYRHCRPPLPNVYTPTTCNDDGTTEDNNCHDSMENFSKLNIHPMTMTTKSLHKTCDYNNHEQHLDNPSTSFNCLQPSMQTLIAKMHWMHHLSWTKIYARVILENTYSPDHIWCSTFKAIKSQVHHKLNSMCRRTTKSSTSSYNMFLYPLNKDR